MSAVIEVLDSREGECVSTGAHEQGSWFWDWWSKTWVRSWLLLPLGFILQSFICVSSSWLTKTASVGDASLPLWCSRRWGGLQNLPCCSGDPVWHVFAPLLTTASLWELQFIVSHRPFTANPETKFCIFHLPVPFCFLVSVSQTQKTVEVSKYLWGTSSYPTAQRRVSYSWLLRTMSSQVFSVSKDGDSITSPGSLLQCLTMLTLKKF